MRTSYAKNDVCFLLKDVTGHVKPLPASEREKYIQAGLSYSEMIPLEYEPTRAYLQSYFDALAYYANDTAAAVGIVTKEIVQRKGKRAVLVSLARAGTPIGILVRRYADHFYGADFPHYSVSIIRGKGIDKNAICYILNRHDANDIVFIDGWTGKGAIAGELQVSMKDFPAISPMLAVLSDPAGVSGICGSRNDMLIPSACLNSTVSGLVSRTFHRDDLISENDFHGAMYYEEQEQNDLSCHFIDTIQAHFVSPDMLSSKDERPQIHTNNSICCVERIAKDFGINNIHFIKPGIGETIRVLLRRVPRMILVQDRFLPELEPILKLANDRGVEVIDYPLVSYKACGLVKPLADVP
jgi:hypothetical protein